MKNRDFQSKYFFVTIIFVSIISLSFGQDCDVGYVPDCADGDCCPESWIGDGFEDCEDQTFGCDLTCYGNDGGDCTSHDTLQSMIDATECGGTLIVPEGDYDEHIIINKCISISAPLCPDDNCGDGRAAGYKRVKVKSGTDIDLHERDDCWCDDVTLEGIEFFADSTTSSALFVLPHDDTGQSALSLTITNSIIDGGGYQNGLRGSYIDELFVTGTTFTHSYTGVYITGGENYECGSVANHHINESSFIDNDYNIYISSDCEGTFDATYNWWGSPEGPGGSVEGDVDTGNWYADEDDMGGVTGDLNGDGVVNILDVVLLVNMVLGGTEPVEAGDLNGDGTLNVLDVVVLVNMVLGGRVDGATSATFHVIGNEVTMTANGHVRAVQMILSHSENFALTLIGDALVAQHLTEGSTTRLMIVEPAQSSLFTASGDFTIESVIAASNGESYMQTSINMPKEFSISAAYPNPFNPITQMMLDLNTDENVSVKVFNTLGQLVDIIAEGQKARGSYVLTWDGSNATSGVYLIRTEIAAKVHSQKIMLMK